ncbi:MAG: cytochrome c-type biogenesis protein CcmH [Gammaproteobacteria bacterium]|jgi:cytochrome c-type biogenesis protein CcmH
MSFWIVVAALLLIAMLILVVPLMRPSGSDNSEQRLAQNIRIAREKKELLQDQLANAEIDQPGFDAAYVDLQTALALELEVDDAVVEKRQGNWMAALVLVFIPLLSVFLYFSFGQYDVVENPSLAQRPSEIDRQAVANMSLDEMLTAIKDKLRENPDDARGWYAMGQTYMGMERYEEAVTAFKRTHELAGDDPAILFSLADALALKNDGNLLGEPEPLVARGLELSPRYPNGLWLAGLIAEQKNDYKKAHEHWSTLLPLIADNEQSYIEVERLIVMLEQRDPEIAASAQAASARAAVGNSISLTIDIDAELKSQASPDDAVFIYAKAMQGPPMPLAVKKLQLRDLPVLVTLSDADAMMPTMKLSSFDQVIVGARLSKSGNPVAQSGDFYTERDGIDSANPPAELRLTIDQIK